MAVNINEDSISLYSLQQILRQFKADIDDSFSDYLINNVSQIKDVVVENNKLIIKYVDATRQDLEIPLDTYATMDDIIIPWENE